MHDTPAGLHLDDTIHAHGTQVQLPPVLTRALAWDVAATLMERHDDLVVVELHPGGGQYDCLSVYERPGALVCHLNITGSLTHARWQGGDRITWLEVLINGAAWAAELIEDVTDIDGSCKLPDAEVVTARACAHLAAAFALRDDVELLSAVADGSYGASVRYDLIETYQAVCDDLELDVATVGAGAYRWWLLTCRRDGHAAVRACIDMSTARLWLDPDTEPVALAGLPPAQLVSMVAARM